MTTDFRDHLLEICLSQRCVDEEDYYKEDRSFQSVRKPVAGEKVGESADHARYEDHGFDKEQLSSGRPSGLDARYKQRLFRCVVVPAYVGRPVAG
jgi:hypothetical protein